MESGRNSDQLLSPDAWRSLTVLERKVEYFSHDVYFRECWADVEDILGTAAIDTLSKTGLLVFKPDAVIGRRIAATLTFLQKHEFRVVCATKMQFNRYSSAETWRFNWNFATVDRIKLSTLLYSATEVICLLISDRDSRQSVPVSVRLSELKGSASSPNTKGDRLRDTLGMPNRLLNFVHVADEPADIVRELGIFFEEAERRVLLKSLQKGMNSTEEASELPELIDYLYKKYPEHDLSVVHAMGRLVNAGALTNSAAATLLQGEGGTRYLRWDSLCALVNPTHPNIDVWDFICVGTALIDDEREGHADLLPSTGSSDWSGRG